jgi:transketolase
MNKIHNPREEYGKTLLSLCHKNQNVVALDADLCKSTMTCKIEEELPDQYFEMGIGEQNMMSVAAGMSLTGKIPFVNSFAIFLTSRAFDQIRQAICNASLNVKIIGSSAGLSDFGDGSSHQTVEDISIMRSLPNMTVVVPCDGRQTGKMTEAIAQYHGPVYMRVSRNDMTDLTSPDSPFEIGKVYTLREGSDVTVFTCGIMVEKALEAAEKLAQENISVMVVNVATIKPLERKEITRLSKRTGLVVTAEEHSIIGGLGSAVTEALRNEKIPIEFIGINDQFGVSCNDAEPLLELYGLTSKSIISTIKNSLNLKNK